MTNQHAIDFAQASLIEEHPLYKKNRQEIREKAVQKKERAERRDASSNSDPKALKLDSMLMKYHQDSVHLTNVDSSNAEPKVADGDQNTLDSDSDDSSSSLLDDIESDILDRRKSQEFFKRLVQLPSFNMSQLYRYIPKKIDFKKRVSELKSMYQDNWVQSRSDNAFSAAYAKFKVGVVGSILSCCGVSIQDLDQLKRDAFEKAFNENCALMKDNIYSSELTELLYGKSGKSRTARRMYHKQEALLIQGMNQLGRPGYWSETRLLEQRRDRCQDIIDEWVEELTHLKYKCEYIKGESHDAA